MEVNLKATPEEIKDKFFSLNNREDIASLLEIDLKTLNYNLYRLPPELRYKTFEINKRKGGLRPISAPTNSLKILQKKLNHVLNIVYSPRTPTHGFVTNRSIVTNARRHLDKKFVLNIDIQEFFPSINFGRVRGLFLAKPYNLPNLPATVLAQIVCFNNQLPQGAPTSPTVSNMICAKMDRQLLELARGNLCIYTRYADDISFSTTRRSFPQNIAYKDSEGQLIIGPQLETIISENGFEVNRNKVSLRTKALRQEVTGLTVNEYLNVKREYIRQIRAMLYAWQKFGLEAAQNEYLRLYCKKSFNPQKTDPNFAKVVKGKINYVRMVKGDDNPVYRKLAKKYNQLAGGGFPDYPNSPFDPIIKSLWVLESNDNQGTAFSVKDVGIVTCAHVLDDTTFAYRYNRRDIHYPIEIICKNDELDIAILKINDDYQDCLEVNNEPIRLPEDYHKRVFVVGFPNQDISDEPYIAPGLIASERRHYGQERLFISGANIVGGNSGGPLLDEYFNVVGIIVTGADSFSESSERKDHGAIPIKNLQYLLETQE